MPESTEDGIKINYPKYDLSDNFLESVREVFGNIKIDLELNIENEIIKEYIFILMTYPFYYKIFKKKSDNKNLFIKFYNNLLEHEFTYVKKFYFKNTEKAEQNNESNNFKNDIYILFKKNGDQNQFILINKHRFLFIDKALNKI